MKKEKSTRREFLEQAGMTGAIAGSFGIGRAGAALGPQAGSRIRLGMIGCGGRGTWIADLFRQHGGYELTAAADYFADRVDSFGQRFGVPEQRRYKGLSGYRRLLDARIVDAVAIESPPYFHPGQAADAVEAGCHVYLAKPVAVDAPGCRSVAATGRMATRKRLCLLVDFQTRVDPFYLEAIKRVHAGAIGRFAFGEASYHASNPFTEQQRFLEDDPADPENRLRAWGLDRALSGDIITEQNIHTLDVASWIMDQEPVSATGVGGHKVRDDRGSCFDHFTLLFEYPDKVGVTFSSRQFEGHDTQPEGIRNRMFGSLGVLETQYGGTVLLRGKNFYRGGSTQAIYKEGAVRNIAEFHRSVTGRVWENPTVDPSVRSNLVTILGRTAAYRGGVVTWREVVESEETLDPGLKGLKD